MRGRRGALRDRHDADEVSGSSPPTPRLAAHPRGVLLPLIRMSIGVRALSGSPRRAGGPTGAVLRILGARQVLQSAIVARTGWHGLSAVVDLLHGASMLVLLALAPRWRRFAATQAAAAAALAALELRAAR